jgi:alkanesulfonate monooxygenase SsuD/methylene tetrahydromethanopterin reductase-like flavin-dependent oxidoreductase (luciferase family)
LSKVEVGVRAPHSLFGEGPGALAEFAAGIERRRLDRVWVGDHVSFRGGQGYDGLLQAAVLGSLTRHVTIQTAVYLLPLRHPLPVARQVSTISEIAPGRLVFGVGVGGDDRAEVSNCGVNPSGRGRRMDESLALVRRLLSGEEVHHRGPEFEMSGALIRPVPVPGVPVAVGGRSDAALRRAAHLSEGWLGVFVDPQRFAESVDKVHRTAEAAGRSEVEWRHGVLAWCGFGTDKASARSAVAPAMEGLYQMPFERFERYAPHGTPDDVAAALQPYLEAGASYVLLSPFVTAGGTEGALDAAAEVRELLLARSPRPG